MMKPLVSISIPVYNQEHYLYQCLDSVLAQTYDRWECVLVDDGSTDSSGIICDEYAKKDNRFKVVHKKNAGLAAARQTGLDNIVGKYVVNIDGDDWVEPNHLMNMVNVAERENADIVMCAYYENTSKEQRLVENKPSAYDIQTLQCEVLEGVYHAGVVLKLFSTRLFKDNHIKKAPYDYYEDMYTFISCLQFSHKVVYSSVPSYHYRIHETSLTQDKNLDKRIRLYEECMRNLDTLIQQYDYQDNCLFMSSVYIRANNEKGRLLGYIRNYHRIKPYFLKYFPKSYKMMPKKPLASWTRRRAFEGDVIPFATYKVLRYVYRRIVSIIS